MQTNFGEHVFGSSTDLKLSMVAGYLGAFTRALKDKPSPQRPFKLWYIDAFAGTGERTVKLAPQEADFWQPSQSARVEARRGSAQIALDTKPKFDRLIFIDRKRKHVDALRELAARHPDRDVKVVKGDANQTIQAAMNWDGWRGVRAVMFLDPYGMGVEWETLRAVAKTRAVDVWYLVSLSGLYRQATKRVSALDEKKRAALTRMLGTDEWERAWYSEPEQAGLPFEFETESNRTADLGRMEAFVTRRLGELFPAVLILPRFGGHPC